MDDGARAVAAIEGDVGGGHFALGQYVHRAEVYVMAAQVGEDAFGIWLLGQYAAPGATVAALAEDDQGVGAIAAAPHLLSQSAHLRVFGGIAVYGVDDVQGGNTDAQYLGHVRWWVSWPPS